VRGLTDAEYAVLCVPRRDATPEEEPIAFELERRGLFRFRYAPASGCTCGEHADIIVSITPRGRLARALWPAIRQP